MSIFSDYYERSPSQGPAWHSKGNSTAADRRTLTSPLQMAVTIGSQTYFLTAPIEIDLDVSASWDVSSYATAANRAGMQFYIYACQPTSGLAPVILISANSTYPSGYTAANSRKVGTFHCLCAGVGTISGHSLTGYLTGDILPRSIQDLKHRPRAGFIRGLVWAGATAFDSLNGPQIWVAIYLASGTGGSTASAYAGTISDTRNWLDFVADFSAIGCRLLRDHEFQSIAAGSNEETNISGSTDPGTTGGHVDTAGRRMVSNIGCEDCCGASWQWLNEQSYKSPVTAGWGWYDLPGAKGSLYNYGGTAGDADIKLIAGGYWISGAYCGSRSRAAYYPRWYLTSDIGGRFAAEPA